MSAAEHRAKAAEAERRAAESFERSDTDGFLSQHANTLTARLERLKARVIERGGKAGFVGLYEGDRRVKAKLISVHCKFSHGERRCWLLHDDEQERFSRTFIPQGDNSRIQKKLGLCQRRETAPAYAFMNGRGTGLSGTAWPDVARKNPDEWGMDAEVCHD